MSYIPAIIDQLMSKPLSDMQSWALQAYLKSLRADTSRDHATLINILCEELRSRLRVVK
jgi:hypothetical protein